MSRETYLKRMRRWDGVPAAVEVAVSEEKEQVRLLGEEKRPNTWGYCLVVGEILWVLRSLGCDLDGGCQLCCLERHCVVSGPSSWLELGHPWGEPHSWEGEKKQTLASREMSALTYTSLSSPALTFHLSSGVAWLRITFDADKMLLCG